MSPSWVSCRVPRSLPPLAFWRAGRPAVWPPLAFICLESLCRNVILTHKPCGLVVTCLPQVMCCVHEKLGRCNYSIYSVHSGSTLYQSQANGSTSLHLSLESDGQGQLLIEQWDLQHAGWAVRSNLTRHMGTASL